MGVYSSCILFGYRIYLKAISCCSVPSRLYIYMFHVSIDEYLSSNVCASFETFNLKDYKCASQFNDHH